LNDIYKFLFDPAASKGEQRRYQIIQAGTEHIAKSGYVGGLFEQISKKLNIRRSHVSYYFEDRDSLFTEIIKYIIGTAQYITVEKVKAASSPEERILAMSDAAFDWSEKYPEQSKVLLFFFYLSSTDTRFQSMNSAIRNAGFERIRTLLKSHHEKSNLVPSEIDHMAKAIQMTITSCVLEAMSTKGDLNTFREISRKVCKRLIG